MLYQAKVENVINLEERTIKVYNVIEVQNVVKIEKAIKVENVVKA